MYTVYPAGAENIVLSLVRHLDRDRFNPVVCSFKGGELLGEFLKIGIPVHVLGKKSGIDFSAFLALYRIIRNEHIDIIHSHNFSPNLWGRIIGLLAKVPVIITTEHTVATAKSNLQRIIDRLLSLYTNRIIAVSERVRLTHCELEGLDPEKILTIYNGVEYSMLDYSTRVLLREEFCKEFNLPTNQCLITTVGRLEPPKGHENLLKAVPLVVSECPEAKFVIVGDGSLRSQLVEFAEEASIVENIIFTGFRSDVYNILSLSDICVVPSNREGFSVTVLEAMASEKPIIATDVGGNAEALTNGESGIIVKPNDPTELAEGIIGLIKNRDRSHELGRNARKRFNEKFTIKKMVDNFEMLYVTEYTQLKENSNVVS